MGHARRRNARTDIQYGLIVNRTGERREPQYRLAYNR
jgi:hypothetical protein